MKRWFISESYYWSYLTASFSSSTNVDTLLASFAEVFLFLFDIPNLLILFGVLGKIDILYRISMISCLVWPHLRFFKIFSVGLGGVGSWCCCVGGVLNRSVVCAIPFQSRPWYLFSISQRSFKNLKVTLRSHEKLSFMNFQESPGRSWGFRVFLR